jgi:hypothetical protein
MGEAINSMIIQLEEKSDYSSRDEEFCCSSKDEQTSRGKFTTPRTDCFC